MAKSCPNNCKEGRVLVGEAAGSPLYLECAFCPDAPPMPTQGLRFDPEDGVIKKDGAPIAVVYRSDDFPCLEDDEREDVDAEANATGRVMAAAPDYFVRTKHLLEVTTLILRANCNAVPRELREAIARLADVHNAAEGNP
jgi:hypothetical protein